MSSSRRRVTRSRSRSWSPGAPTITAVPSSWSASSRRRRTTMRCSPGPASRTPSRSSSGTRCPAAACWRRPSSSGCRSGTRAYVVDPEWHTAISTNPRLQFMEFFAKNVAVRRSHRGRHSDDELRRLPVHGAGRAAGRGSARGRARVPRRPLRRRSPLRLAGWRRSGAGRSAAPRPRQPAHRRPSSRTRLATSCCSPARPGSGCAASTRPSASPRSTRTASSATAPGSKG